METTYIYALLDPVTDLIRYVGKTNNPKQRLKNHCNSARYRNTHKFNWIKQLRKQKLKPNLIILDEVLLKDWKFWEQYWISQCKTWGFNLVNYHKGGQGLTYGNQTSFKKGHIPWNKGTSKPKKLKGNRGKTKQSIKYQFKKGHIPWNKGTKGIKTKSDKNVYQYDKGKTVMIRKWNTAKQAAEALNINPEGIGQCARGNSKSSGGFYWNYKNILL